MLQGSLRLQGSDKPLVGSKEKNGGLEFCRIESGETDETS
jgi:hypothetical protein